MDDISVTVCPHCGTEYRTRYSELGVAISCRQCYGDMIPAIPVGGKIASGAYSITFTDFKKLLRENRPENDLGEALAKWYGYTLDLEQGAVLTERLEHIDLVWLHRKIQADKDQQYFVYGLTWRLWH